MGTRNCNQVSVAGTVKVKRAEGQVMGMMPQRQDGAGPSERFEREAMAGLPAKEDMICFGF